MESAEKVRFRSWIKPGLSRAFTLLEVVVAVGIFATAMVAIVGMYIPIARSVTASSDAEAATRVSDAMREKLGTLPRTTVEALLKNSTSKGHELTDADAKPDYDVTKDSQLMFASRDGAKIGVYSDPVWIDPTTKRPSDREKFFEIALVRNETVSPKLSATVASEGRVLAYVARLRWPAFVTDAAGNTVQFGSNPNGAVKFDHSGEQELFVAGALPIQP